MKRYKCIAFFTIVSLMLSGCLEKPVRDIDLPPMHSKIVLFCCIAPDLPVVVDLDVSTLYGYNRKDSYNEPPRDYMRSAIVMLTDVHTGQQVQLVYDDSYPDYNSIMGYPIAYSRDHIFVLPEGQQFDIVPGHEYRISAEYEDYPPVSASTVVPNGEFDIQHLGIAPASGHQEGYSYYHTTVEVHNQTDEPATFWVGTEVQTFAEHHDTYYDTTTGAWKVRIRLQHNWNRPFEPIYVQAQPNGLATAFLEHSSPPPFQLDTLVSATVRQVNADFMRFHSSAGSNNDDFMIFPQQAEVYTNIEGGLGIFCAYVEQKRYIINPL